MGHVVASIDQDHFRVYGGELQTSQHDAPAAALDTNATIPIGGTFFLRIALKETAGADTKGEVYKLQYRDSVDNTWRDVTTTPNIYNGLQLVNSAQITNGTATSQVISSGGFTAGEELDTSAQSSSITIGANNSSEYEWALRFEGDDAVSAVGNGCEFRVLADNAVLSGTYQVTPNLTVGAVALERSFRWRNDDGSESAATWMASTNTNITVATAPSGTHIQRIRFGVKNTSTWMDYDRAFQFQHDIGTGWGNVGTSGNNYRRDTTYWADEAATTQQITTARSAPVSARTTFPPGPSTFRPANRPNWNGRSRRTLPRGRTRKRCRSGRSLTPTPLTLSTSPAATTRSLLTARTP